MTIKASDNDRRLYEWFSKDYTHNLLRSIELKKGNLRALSPFIIEFQYPIALIAGTNGCGKSTLLAIAACGFHKNKVSHSQNIMKKDGYYTFGSFIIQSQGEVPPAGIEIIYQTAQQDSEKNDIIKKHELKKVVKGKWTSYQKRVLRNVEFFGIERVVPHYEKSVSKSYRRNFKAEGRTDVETNTEESVSRILGKPYKNFELQKHTTHTLPKVSRDSFTYSGFNMGAGESALFEIFYTLHSCENASLIVIDEIELGLHASAQIKFIEELKKLCLKKKLQIIATTHSSTALSSVPPYARFYIESHEGETLIKDCITAEYATGMLSGRNSEELTIFVEDETAKEILSCAFDSEIRSRVVVIAIGSDLQVIRYLASHHKSQPSKKYIAYVDGDKADMSNQHISELTRTLESTPRDSVQDFYKNNVFYLGEKINPEKWLLNTVKTTALEEFSEEFEISPSLAKTLIEEAVLQPAHYEFPQLSLSLHATKEDITRRTARILFKNNLHLKQKIVNDLKNILNPAKNQI